MRFYPIDIPLSEIPRNLKKRADDAAFEDKGGTKKREDSTRRRLKDANLLKPTTKIAKRAVGNLGNLPFHEEPRNNE